MKKKLLVILTVLIVAGADVAHGAFTAIYKGGDAGFSVWDNFTNTQGPGGTSTATFANLVPNTAGGGYSSSLLSSTTNAGAGMFGGGDRIYGAINFAVPVSHELSLFADYVVSATNTVMLQIALSEPSDTFLGADAATRARNYFAVTMNGLAPAGVFIANTSAQPSGTFHTIAFIFSTTGYSAGTDLNFVLNGYDDTAGHVSLDAIAISAAPEPSRAILAFAGLGFLMMRRKRRKAFAVL